MKYTVYLETSIVSYYTSKFSNDIIILAHQAITREWWEKDLNRFNIYISEVVIEEAGAGDPEASKLQLFQLKNIPHLEITDKVAEISKIYIKKLQIPKKAIRDALHLAIACVHEIDYLLTWNCTHLANGEIMKKLIQINKAMGVHTPIICTPEELRGR